MKIVHLITAARPNMMKIGPLWHAFNNCGWAQPVLVHTGQHYDKNMSDIFLQQLGLPVPDHQFNIGGGSHNEQHAKVIETYDALCQQQSPDLVLVVGDVNATASCALAAKKRNLLVAHMEAGLRSNDRTMPEEINRLVTDSISDIHWVPSQIEMDILARENIQGPNVRMVGNIMIDALVRMLPAIKADTTRSAMGLPEKAYAVITLHRPVNVDEPAQLQRIIDLLLKLSVDLPLVFPVHPRTRTRIENMGLMPKIQASGRIHLVEPLGYVQFINLVSQSACVVTDSGGIQEETSYLGVPCLTLRESTERPVTVKLGTNTLVNLDSIHAHWPKAIQTLHAPANIPLWDGQTAARTLAHLQEIFEQKKAA